MADVQICVRVPEQLIREADALVGKGHYKNRSDAVVYSLRRELESKRPEPREMTKLRKAKREIWQEYLKKAKGDEHKAYELMFEDIEKKY